MTGILALLGVSVMVVAGAPLSRADEYFPTAITLNPFVTQQASFSHNQYQIYPTPYSLQVPLIREGNVQAGPFKIHPHLGVAQLYSDNVYRVSQNKQSDTYTAYQPGAQVQLPILGRHMWVVDYRAYLERYSRDSSLDVNDYTASTGLVLDFPGGLTARMLGQLKNGHDYRGSATAALPVSGATSSINQFYNTIYGGEVEWKSQNYLRAQWQAIRWQFIGPLAGTREPGTAGDINTRNRQEQYASLAAGRLIAPKTYLFLQGQMQKEQYEVNTDLNSTVYTGLVGLKWEATGKSTGNLGVGVQSRSYEYVSTRGSGTFTGLYFNGSVFWQAQEKTRVIWTAYRQSNETVVGGTRYFVGTGTTVDVQHAVAPKWTLLGGVRYEHDQYSDPITADGKRADRQDDYVTVGGGVNYRIQSWLGARLVYLYTERLSNFSSVAYNANQVMLSLQSQF